MQTHWTFYEDKKLVSLDMAKEKKDRKEKYDPKLVVKGSFADVIKASISKPPTKPESKKD